MRKRLNFWTSFAFFIVMLIVALNIKINIHQKQLSFINFQNIEALSYAESSGSRCYGTGSVDCPINKEKVLYVYN